MAARGSFRQWWTDRSMRAKGLIVIALPLVALFLIVPLDLTSNHEAREARNRVADTLEVRTRIEDVRSLTFEATSRLRGYLLTESPSFRETYETAARELPTAISSLDRLVADNPSQASRVTSLRTRSEHLTGILADLAETVPTSAPGSGDRAQILESKLEVDRIARLLGAMRAEEDRLLVERQAAARSAEFLTTAISAIAVGAGLVGGLVAVLLFAAGVVRRMRRLEENATLLAEGKPLLPAPEGRDEVGRLGEALETASDLLREREQALIESEERLRAILDHSTSVIFMKDVDGRFMVLNRTFEEMFNISRRDAVGKTVHDLFPKEAADPWRDNDRAVMEGKVPIQFEETAPRDDGEHVYLSTKVPMLDEQGEPYGLVGISTDITERKRAEEALRSARAEAERANRAKSEFLSRMSHELRTPMNAVLGFAQLLAMDELTAEQRESTAHILKAGRHLLDLINEVLDISRIEAGRLTLSAEAVRVGDALKDALDLIRPIAEARGVQIVMDATVSGHHVLADRQRLKQVLLNLLSNGVKYNHEGGSVVLSCEEQPAQRFRVAMTDTGPGIGPEEIERVFAPFDRLGRADGDVEGTGLGLALSKGLVEAMGGSLTVSSAVGAGSTFAIELPLAESPVDRYEREVRDEPDSAAVLSRAASLLCIEDNLSNLKLIQRVMERRPQVSVIQAMQARLGLELARQHRPSLILLDLHLPDARGDEVLRQLRADPITRDIPVIVVSADATPTEVRRLLDAGAMDYLTKPLDVRRFLTVVDTVLGAIAPSRSA